MPIGYHAPPQPIYILKRHSTGIKDKNKYIKRLYLSWFQFFTQFWRKYLQHIVAFQRPLGGKAAARTRSAKWLSVCGAFSKVQRMAVHRPKCAQVEIYGLRLVGMLLL